jgi:methyltransferase family protein
MFGANVRRPAQHLPMILAQLTRTLKAIKFSAQACKTLLSDQAYFSSVRNGELRDHENNYVPWFTYPAIEALKNWDLSEKRVFEYGSGYSTLFWASRAKEVVSVEHNRGWYEKVAGLAPSNARLILAPIDGDDYDPSPELLEQFKAYAEAIDGQFDIIVVDGYARSRVRYQCAQAALPHLNSNGVIILDNSDWLPATSMLLREANLIEVDFNGAVPGNSYTQTTSFFFTRQFDFQPAGPRQPVMPIGGRPDNWEKGLEQELLERGNRATKPVA